MWAQLMAEEFRGLGNLAVGVAGTGESGLISEQGQVCLIWGFRSFAHLCLDSFGQQIFLDSLLCAN